MMILEKVRAELLAKRPSEFSEGELDTLGVSLLCDILEELRTIRVALANPLVVVPPASAAAVFGCGRCGALLGHLPGCERDTTIKPIVTS